MAYSLQRDVSNGTLQYLEVRIAYFAKTHLTVFIAEKVVPQGTTPDPVSGYCWTWDGNRIKFNKNVANGLEVMVRRNTPIAEPFHIFRQGAVFKDLTVDENFLQQLYINQENQEGQTTTDFYSDLNFHGYRLRNVGAALHDYDAVPFSQYRADVMGAMQQRILAEQARDTAVASKNTAVAAKDAALVSQNAAKVSETAAATSAADASTSATSANTSANTATTKATASAASATAAKADADRAKASADSIDPVLLNQKIDDALARITTTEAAIASAKATLRNNIGVPLPWGSAPLPSGYIKMNGQAFDKTANPRLAAMYPSGNVPDLRGEFLRGVDDGRGVDAGRTVGSSQSDAIRNIKSVTNLTLTVMHDNRYLDNGVMRINDSVTSIASVDGGTGSLRRGGWLEFDASRVVPTANENRPRNVAVLYICMTDAAIPV